MKNSQLFISIVFTLLGKLCFIESVAAIDSLGELTPKEISVNGDVITQLTSGQHRNEQSQWQIMRIGSAPHIQHYASFNPKSDNSYALFSDGRYEEDLKKFGVDLKNVLHTYWIESDEIPTDLSAKFPDYKNMRHNFHVPFPAQCKDSIDFAITDSRTTKFFSKREDFVNVLSCLKVGGKLILTDINERYAKQGRQTGMSYLKISKNDIDRVANMHINSPESVLLKELYEAICFNLDEENTREKKLTYFKEHLLDQVIKAEAGENEYIDFYTEYNKVLEKDLQEARKHENDLVDSWYNLIASIDSMDDRDRDLYSSYFSIFFFEYTSELQDMKASLETGLKDISALIKMWGYEIKKSETEEGISLVDSNDLMMDDSLQYLFEKGIYGFVDELFDPRLSEKQLQEQVYERTIDFESINITTRFYDSWEIYQQNGSNGEGYGLEEYLYNIGQNLYDNLGNFFPQKTSDRIVVITKNP